MPRFLIEAHHESEPVACARAVKVFLSTGSHYLTTSDWGCLDGQHATWLMVDAESKEQARAIVPAVYRSQAKVIALNKFTLEEMETILAHHKG